jgi:hypothetical protein
VHNLSSMEGHQVSLARDSGGLNRVVRNIQGELAKSCGPLDLVDL